MSHPATTRRSALRVTILFTLVIAAAYGFGVYLFASLVPDMREGLGLDYAAVGAIGAARQAAFLAAALATPLAVRLGGANHVILGSLLVCGVALFGLAATRSAWLAVALLIALNACAASAWVPMVSVVATVVAFEHRGKAVGLIASGTNVGLCANGVLVSLVLTGFGWRFVWAAAGGLTLILGLSLWLTMRGAAPLLEGDPGPSRDATAWRRAVAPRYGIVYMLAGFGGLAGVLFATYLSAHLRDDLHLSVALSGEAWLAMGLCGALGGGVLGALGDRLGLRAALGGATTVLAASGVVVATGTSPAAMMIAASGFGASFFSIFGLLPSYVGKTAEPRAMATICALIECALGLGGIAGSALGGLSPHVAGSFRPVFVATAALGFAMLALTRGLPREEGAASLDGSDRRR